MVQNGNGPTSLIGVEMIDSGFLVVRNVVPKLVVSHAVRQINVEIFQHGVSDDEISDWNKTACWLPFLAFAEPFETIRSLIPESFKSNVPAGPQIVVVPPEPNVLQSDIGDFHVDDVPDWAKARNLKLYSIVGVALTPMTNEMGGLRIRSEVVPPLFPGDMIVLHPSTYHTRGINMTEFPRYTFYYRWLISNEKNRDYHG